MELQAAESCSFSVFVFKVFMSLHGLPARGPALKVRLTSPTIL